MFGIVEGRGVSKMIDIGYLGKEDFTIIMKFPFHDVESVFPDFKFASRRKE